MTIKCKDHLILKFKLRMLLIQTPISANLEPLIDSIHIPPIKSPKLI